VSRQKPKEFWEKHIEAFRETKLSQTAYCKTNKLRYKSFQYHLRKKREKEKQNNPEKSSEWLPMTIIDEPASNSPGGIRLHFNKIIIEAEKGFDSTHLANLLRTVGAVC